MLHTNCLIGFGARVGAGNDSFTKLLIHADGANGSTSIVDASRSARAITVAGNAKIDTSQSKFGGSSILFDGNGDWITCADSTDFTFSGDFTIDFWIKTSNSTLDTVARRVLSFGDDTVSSPNFLFYDGASATTNLSVRASSAQVITGNIAVANGSWNHVALTRAGSAMKLWVNGAQSGSTATNSTAWDGGTLVIGTYATLANVGNIDGWMDEIRISNGIARWNAAFTPPTVAYG